MNANVTPLNPSSPALPRPRVSGGQKGATVAERIREMIIQDELPPGAPIRERSLSEQLNVSRTPLREALKILSAEGLVELQPHRGAVVAAPTSAEVRELLEVLSALEALAGELACNHVTETDIKELQALHFEMLAAYTRDDRLGYFRRNQEIHIGLVACSRNQALIQYHKVVNARVYRARYICNLKTHRWELAIKEHEGMLDALEQKDAARLSQILRTHVLQAWDKMEEMLNADAAPRKRGKVAS